MGSSARHGRTVTAIGVAFVLVVNAALAASALPVAPQLRNSQASGEVASGSGAGAAGAATSDSTVGTSPERGVATPAGTANSSQSAVASAAASPSPAPSGIAAVSALGSPPAGVPSTSPKWSLSIPAASPPAVAAALAPPSPSGPPPKPAHIPDLQYHVPILMYHRVLPADAVGNNMPGLVVTTDVFTAQMQALYDAGWRTILLRDLAAAMREGRTLPPRTFAVTFDDGWADGYDYAYPIIRRLGYVGVFFVITSRINGPGQLSQIDLLDLEATGNEIGNHTANHVSLSSVKYARVKEEVETASASIAQMIHKRPTSLAYPMGGIADYTVQAVGEVPGIQIGVTTRSGVTESWINRLDLPRIRISSSTKPDALVNTMTWRTGL